MSTIAADTRDDFKALFEKCLQSILPRFSLAELKDEQKKAMFYLLSGKDVFVNLPTGFGKSLIYQLTPLVAEELSRHYGNIRIGIVLVISPLVSLIKDQVKGLQRRGVKASFIGAGQEEANFKEIVNGEMNIVYSSPEAMLANDRWREMICSQVYQKNVVAVAVDEAHCITHW